AFRSFWTFCPKSSRHSKGMFFGPGPCGGTVQARFQVGDKDNACADQEKTDDDSGAQGFVQQQGPPQQAEKGNEKGDGHGLRRSDVLEQPEVKDIGHRRGKNGQAQGGGDPEGGTPGGWERDGGGRQQGDGRAAELTDGQRQRGCVGERL